MSTTRRQLLAGLASLPLVLSGRAALAEISVGNARRVDATGLHRYNDGRASRPLRVLVLGGTQFVGPAVVRYALDRGHEVTLFNRGLTNPHLFPEAKRLRGDRETADATGLGALRDGNWDIVVDTWSAASRAVEQSLTALDGRYRRYAFVSSVAVYRQVNYRKPEVNESMSPPNPTPQELEPRADGQVAYAIRKLVAENAVREHAGRRGMIVRAHQVFGRYMAKEGEAQLYWPVRIQEGGDVLSPGDGADFMQYIDVADLGRFIVRACEQEAEGIFNACRRQSWTEFLYGLRAAVATPVVRLRWAPWEFLQAQKMRPFTEIPLWVPRQDGPGFFNIRATRAESAGLSFRPFGSTVADMLACANEFLPSDYVWGGDVAGAMLNRARERTLLAALAKV